MWRYVLSRVTEFNTLFGAILVFTFVDMVLVCSLLISVTVVQVEMGVLPPESIDRTLEKMFFIPASLMATFYLLSVALVARDDFHDLQTNEENIDAKNLDR